MKLRKHASDSLRIRAVPASPLWQRAPARDPDGRALTDFMMLIPRLRSWPQAEIEHASREIHAILALHRDVVFADLNLKLNLLWVSLYPRPGAISELVAAIRLRVPQAVLVGHRVDLR